MNATKGLLIHWWHYYGKCVYTLEEFNEFIALIDEKGADTIFDIAATAYLCGDGSPTILLLSIRENKVEDLFKALEDLKAETKPSCERESFQKARQKFYEIISSTFNQPAN